MVNWGWNEEDIANGKRRVRCPRVMERNNRHWEYICGHGISGLKYVYETTSKEDGKHIQYQNMSPPIFMDQAGAVDQRWIRSSLPAVRWRNVQEMCLAGPLKSAADSMCRSVAAVKMAFNSNHL